MTITKPSNQSKPVCLSGTLLLLTLTLLISAPDVPAQESVRWTDRTGGYDPFHNVALSQEARFRNRAQKRRLRLLRHLFQRSRPRLQPLHEAWPRPFALPDIQGFEPQQCAESAAPGDLGRGLFGNLRRSIGQPETARGIHLLRIHPRRTDRQERYLLPTPSSWCFIREPLPTIPASPRRRSRSGQACPGLPISPWCRPVVDFQNPPPCWMSISASYRMARSASLTCWCAAMPAIAFP